jgi:hypothetical protein
MKQFMEKRKATGWDEEILIDIKKALDYYIKDKDRKLGVLEVIPNYPLLITIF